MVEYVTADDPAPAERQDARDLQAQLYREIGISAVAAALRFINQPDPALSKAADAEKPEPVAEQTRAA